jgi:site-specific DNA recombinase
MTADVRCAVYTRKSTDEGLDQTFNTLDAQREACEAYILSQAGEGWRVLPERYDDGGFSGGNMKRPAIQQLLDDLDAGKIDVIVVYKVDRLTRSLMDFAKIVERLDARGTSFVSVTQAFNTTNSMGRLTLNVLLSFAQFERELTGERVRDKIAASKAKGMWMGGNVPFGYDLGERCLLVNPIEADQVRRIFSRYLELGSGVQLCRDLREDGIVSKRWTSRSGTQRGGQPFSCGALYYLLQNRLYVGEVQHRGLRHVGEHEAIISIKLFDEVQEALAQNRRQRKERPTRTTECHLAGFIYDGSGEPMTTSFSYGRGGRLYRYYVAGSLDPSRTCIEKAQRVPAAPLESLVMSAMRKLVAVGLTWPRVAELVKRVELHGRSIQVVLNSAEILEPGEPSDAAVLHLAPQVEPHRLMVEGNDLRLIVDRAATFRGGRSRGLDVAQDKDRRPQELPELLRAAHQLLEQHGMSPMHVTGFDGAIAPLWQRQRRMMHVGLLAPTLQRRIVEGANARLSAISFEEAPLAWFDQIALGDGPE